MQHFLNGTEIGSSTTAPTSLASIPDSLAVGCFYADDANNSFDGDAHQLNAVIDEVKIFNGAVSDDELIRANTDRVELDNDNLVMTFDLTLSNGDILKVDANKWTVRKWNASAETESNVKSQSASGDFLFLFPEDTVIYVTADGDTVEGVRLYYRNHYL